MFIYGMGMVNAFNCTTSCITFFQSICSFQWFCVFRSRLIFPFVSNRFLHLPLVAIVVIATSVVLERQRHSKLQISSVLLFLVIFLFRENFVGIYHSSMLYLRFYLRLSSYMSSLYFEHSIAHSFYLTTISHCLVIM